jgi:glycosyltransferase involved in cell wall biosynthesis
VQVFFINLAWDAAGCSYKQAEAINIHTNWDARHFRAIKTYYADSDLTPENYRIDEFISIIEKSDILHFCSADHFYNSPHNFGFDWNTLVKDKIKIFHDYNSFMGTWGERAKARDVWNRKEEMGYDAIFSSIPQAIKIYKDCVYIPDVVDELSDTYTPSDINRKEIIIGHFPTGGGNNKNTDEFNWAFNKFNRSDKIKCRIATNLPHKDIIKIKKECTMGFDALWRGFHGMTTVENIALGIPTMTGINGCFEQVFKNFHQTDTFPFEITNTKEDIFECIKKYKENPELLKTRSKKIRDFAVNTWSYKNIANRIIKEYEKLL